jgi:hypothetical protein
MDLSNGAVSIADAVVLWVLQRRFVSTAELQRRRLCELAAQIYNGAAAEAD